MLELDKNELAKNFVQFGTSRRVFFPLMKRYLFCFKNNRCIFNLDKIIKKCLQTKDYIFELIKEKKNILFLSTRKKNSDLIKKYATESGMPYINNKWIGGLLTNKDEIRKNIKKMNDLKSFSQKEYFSNLLKKEKKRIEKNIEKLEKNYGGVANFFDKIDVLLIIGLKKETIARKEAKILKIPIIALCNTNSNPYSVDNVLIGNDENIKSVEFFLSWISKSIIEAKNKFILFNGEKDKGVSLT